MDNFTMPDINGWLNVVAIPWIQDMIASPGGQALISIAFMGFAVWMFYLFLDDRYS